MSSTAKDFFKPADGHRQAVDLLRPYEFRPDGTRDSVFFAIYNLLGFSVELYLKAFLSKAGMSETELRSKQYGHNLRSLFGEAERRGYSVRNKDLSDIIERLADSHSEGGYRYVRDGGTLAYFSNLNVIVGVLECMHRSMQDELI